MTPRPALVSFGTLAFDGVNAFRFTNAKGISQYTRYQILLVAGESALSATDAAKAVPNYLMDELPQWIAKSPVKFRLVVQLAKAGDAVNVPTAVWSADRELAELGMISLNSSTKNQVAEQKALLTNPLMLPPSIEPSADPVLLARPAAYGVSFGQRGQ